MCRKGGRRCPGQYENREQINARRRARYAERKAAGDLPYQKRRREKAAREALRLAEEHMSKNASTKSTKLSHYRPSVLKDNPCGDYEIYIYPKNNGKDYEPGTYTEVKPIISSGKKLFHREEKASYDSSSNLYYRENYGSLVDCGYASSKTIQGKFDYRNISEFDETLAGFNPIGDSDSPYVFSKGIHYDTAEEISLVETEDVTDLEGAAISKFTGAYYKNINHALHYNEVKEISEEEKERIENLSDDDFFEKMNYDIDFGQDEISVKRVAKLLDSAIDKAPKVQKVVYRGVQEFGTASIDRAGGAENWIKQNYVPGEEIVIDGYQSSTPDPNIALEYFSGSNGALFEIVTPEGLNITNKSGLKGEKEVLLPRGSRYVVSSVRKVNEVIYEDSDVEFESPQQAENVTIVRLIAINSQGEVLDGTNSDTRKELDFS